MLTPAPLVRVVVAEEELAAPRRPLLVVAEEQLLERLPEQQVEVEVQALLPRPLLALGVAEVAASPTTTRLTTSSSVRGASGQAAPPRS